MKKEIVVLVILPTHIIGALSAVRTLHGDSDIKVTIAAYNPAMNKGDTFKEISAVIDSMAKAFPFVERVVPIALDEGNDLFSSGNFDEAATLLKGLLGIEECHEIYYPHDVMGIIYQSLASIYPDAARVCYGDALGLVIEKEAKLSQATSSKVSAKAFNIGLFLGTTMRKIAAPVIGDREGKAAKLRSGLYAKKFAPNKMALILPIFHSGGLDRVVPLTVCKKETALDVIGVCLLGCPELSDYIVELLARFKGREKFLLMTENYADAKRIELDREIEMWCAIIEEYATPGSVVLIKSHPGEVLPRNERIKERLSGDYEIVALDERFKRYPIELWQGLVGETIAICMSYPGISLKYLYGIDVIQPTSETFVERWFPEWTWDLYKDHIEIYTEPLKNLEDWDGESALWRGKYNN